MEGKVIDLFNSYFYFVYLENDQMTYGPKVKQTNNVGFDYKAEAELFPARNRRSTRQQMGYRRFAHAADAVRFAIEELNPEFFLGAHLELTRKDTTAREFAACTKART